MSTRIDVKIVDKYLKKLPKGSRKITAINAAAAPANAMKLPKGSRKISIMSVRIDLLAYAIRNSQKGVERAIRPRAGEQRMLVETPKRE